MWGGWLSDGVATPKYPFSWPELESGQFELQPGQLDPNWAKKFKSRQNFSRSGQKRIFIGWVGWWAGMGDLSKFSP